MTARLLALAAGALLILPAAGCGHSDDEKAVRSVSEGLREDSNALRLSKKKADCIAEAMVENVGIERLQKYDLLTEDLKSPKDPESPKMSKDDAESSADAVTKCVDAKKLLVDAIGTSLEGEGKKCLEEAISDEDVRAIFVSSFRGDQTATSESVVGPMMKCAAGSQ